MQRGLVAGAALHHDVLDLDGEEARLQPSQRLAHPAQSEDLGALDVDLHDVEAVEAVALRPAVEREQGRRRGDLAPPPLRPDAPARRAPARGAPPLPRAPRPPPPRPDA